MHYCYHPDHAPKCVPTAEYEKLLGEGWYDTPTKFPVKGLAEAVSGIPAANENAADKPKVNTKKLGKTDSDMKNKA